MTATSRNLELALRIRTLVQGTENIDDLRQNMDGLADELEQAGQQADQAGNQLDDLEESGRRAGAGAQEASDGMDDLVEGVKGFITLAAAQQIIELNDRLATLKRGFEVATGSQKGAAEALEFVRAVADRLGVSVFDLSQSYLQLTAAAKGSQLEGKATEQIFSSLAGAMSIVGASADDVDNAMNAVAQMMSKGVISAEELRGQLGDVLPGAAQQAAQSLLMTNAEFNKMLESGEVIASEFLPKFATQLEQAMGGGGQQVTTFEAAVARLQNRLIDLATGEVGQALTRFATVLVNALEPALRGLEAVETLTGAVGRAIGGLAAGEVSSALDDFGQSVSEAALNLVGLKSEAQQAAERQKQMAEEAKAATPAIDALQDAVARGELKALPENLQAAIAEFKKTGDAAAATEQAISKFMAAPAQNLSLEGILNLATSLKAVAQDAKGAGDQIASTLGAQLAKLTNDQLVKLEEQARKAMAAAGDNEAARKAFADLGQVIEGVVLARFERLGVDGKEALTGISDAAADALDDFAALANRAELSADAIDKAFEGALAKLDSPEEIEKLKQQIIELGNDGKLTGEQVERAMLLIRQRAQETANDAAFKALADQLAKIREESDREVEASARYITIKQTQIEAIKRLAEAKGDESAAAQASADAAELEIIASRERIGQITQEIDLTKQHIQQLYARANADGQYSDAEREVIEVLKDKVAQLDLERQKIESNLPLQERAAQQAAIMAGPIGQLSRLYAEQAQEHQRAADASDRYYDTQLKQLDGAIRVAKAHGDEAQAAKLQAEQQNILIEQAQSLAQAKAMEAADAAKALDAKRLELLADGELSKADQEQITRLQEIAAEKATAAEQARNHAEAMQEEAKAAKGVVEGLALFENAAARNAQLTKQLDEEAAAFRDTWKEVNTALATFRGETAIAFGLQGIGRFNELTNQIKDAITQAGSAAQDLTENGLRGNITHAQHLAEELEASNSYLNQAAHGAAQALRQALADARAEAEAMTRSLAEAAEETEREILRLQGRKDEILEREHQDKLAKLQEYYDKAGQLGEDEYRKAVERENELYRLKQKQLEEEDRNRPTGGGSNSATGGTSTTTTTYSPSRGGGATISPVFNIHGTVVDRAAIEDLTRRHILPVLKDIERKSR